MGWLNYHHLLYFWTVAKGGGPLPLLVRSCISPSPPSPLRFEALEENLGTRLFKRVGRNLVLTETGQVVCKYADEIFSLGHEMMGVLKGRPAGSSFTLNIGGGRGSPETCGIPPH